MSIHSQISPRQSPPGGANAPPPPPPPPPPLLDNGGIGPGIGSLGASAAAAAAAAASNGGLITPQKLKVQPKKLLPPIDDTRNDLLNAIRSGKCEWEMAETERQALQ